MASIFSGIFVGTGAESSTAEEGAGTSVPWACGVGTAWTSIGGSVVRNPGSPGTRS